jgi:hypothetical protein
VDRIEFGMSVQRLPVGDLDRSSMPSQDLPGSQILRDPIGMDRRDPKTVGGFGLRRREPKA